MSRSTEQLIWQWTWAGPNHKGEKAPGCSKSGTLKPQYVGVWLSW